MKEEAEVRIDDGKEETEDPDTMYQSVSLSFVDIGMFEIYILMSHHAFDLFCSRVRKTIAPFVMSFGFR